MRCHPLPPSRPRCPPAPAATTVASTALAAVCALAFAGCDSGKGTASVTVGTQRPSPTERTTSSPSEPSSQQPRTAAWPSEVRAAVGQPVIIRLPGTAGTGFTWQLSSTPCPELSMVFSQQLESSTDGRVGGPSEWVFTFSANSAGTCELAFVYHRPWERGVPPAESRTVKVIVTAPK